MGMRTYIRSLLLLGHDVTVAAFAIPEDKIDSEDLGVKTYYLQLPRRNKIIYNFCKYWIFKRKSMNECLYHDERINARISAICKDNGIDFIVADMIRTAPYADATGLTWMLDHEDLLSDRYRKWSKNSSGNENILGYLTTSIPSRLRASASFVFRLMLNREAELLEDREFHWTNKALCSSLRSLQETEALASRATRPVFCMPVTVQIPESQAPLRFDQPMSAVFTGGLTYQPNLDALRAYVNHVLPAFARKGVTPPPLHVIGACPEPLRTGLEHPTIRFLGYVPDVNAELQKHQVFFAPIVSGTGIKTKVLEAMACGLPVIALPDAVAGLSAEPMRHYLLADNPDEFVERYQMLKEDPDLARRIGSAAREIAISSYSIEASTRIVGNALDSAMQRESHRSRPKPQHLAERSAGLV
jgi:glycosyltransferase involved in cell wall biosynthesis